MIKTSHDIFLFLFYPIMNYMDLWAVHWNGRDVPVEEIFDGQLSVDKGGTEYIGSIYGKTRQTRDDGSQTFVLACVHVRIRPYFFVEIGLQVQHAQLNAFLDALKRALGKELGEEFVGGRCTKGRSFVGHAPPASSGFLKLTFRSLRALRRASAWLYRDKPHLKQYETRTDPLVRFMHDRNIRQPCCCGRGKTTRPLRVALPSDEDDVCQLTTCEVEHIVSDVNVCQLTTDPSIASVSRRSSPLPLVSSPDVVVASFDLECHSVDGDFPDPRVRGNVVFMICTTFSRLGGEGAYRKSAVVLGDVRRVPGQDDDVELITASSEAALLRLWSEVVRSEGVDVLTGYNVWGFDMKYLHQRAIVNGGVLNPELVDFAGNLSRARDAQMCLTETRVKAGGGRVTDASILATEGVLQADLMYYLARFHPRLDSYKLDAVSRHFLGEEDDGKKTGLSIRRMHDIWKNGSAVDKWEIVSYCVQDALLVTRLLERLTVLPTVFEMANVCTVPPSVVLLQGEQVKVYSLILRHAHARGMFCPSSPPEWARVAAAADASQKVKTVKRTRTPGGDADGRGDNQEEQEQEQEQKQLQGATVLEPCTGAYWTPIVCLDFQSLYPSIMMAHNLCHSTLRVDRNLGHGGQEETASMTEAFCTDAPKGVLPELLEELRRSRDEAKRAMALAVDDAYMRGVYNAKQQAFKVSMNSVYGFCGVGGTTGILPCLEVASAVTAVGRSMLLRAKTMIEETYPGSRIVYGDTDSLMISFAVSDPSECERIGREAARKVTDIFRAPIKLCYEKTYQPFLLFCKKRYVGRILDDEGSTAGTLDCKGVQFVRGDTCTFVKGVCDRIVRKIMYDMDVPGALEEARDAARTLLFPTSSTSSILPLDDFIVTKTIRCSARDILCDIERRCSRCDTQEKCASSQFSPSRLTCRACGYERDVVYKCTTSPAIQVACKLERAQPGNGPRSGDRVPFVYVCERDEANITNKKRRKGASAALCSDVAEDPEVARRAGMIPDGAFYFEHQLKKVLVELLTIVMPRGEGVDTEQDHKKRTEKMMFGDILAERSAKNDRQPMISQFFDASTTPQQ